MKSKIKSMFKNGFFKGTGLAAGLLSTGLFAAAVTGTINTFSPGEVIDAAKFNENFTSLRTAIEAIDPTYSTSETVTHKVWIDGKPIYRKVVNNVLLPGGANGANPTTAHGITNLDTVVRASGTYTDGTTVFMLPHVSPNGAVEHIRLSVNATNIGLSSSTNWSASTGFVILEYTKN